MRRMDVHAALAAAAAAHRAKRGRRCPRDARTKRSAAHLASTRYALLVRTELGRPVVPRKHGKRSRGGEYAPPKVGAVAPTEIHQMPRPREGDVPPR